MPLKGREGEERFGEDDNWTEKERRGSVGEALVAGGAHSALSLDYALSALIYLPGTNRHNTISRTFTGAALEDVNSTSIRACTPPYKTRLLPISISDLVLWDPANCSGNDCQRRGGQGES
ncbi:hypothetical protein TWF128_005741 [Orbilia oligospora]|nr:hypothetical protein TWF128_005741 [Orbilia oligospora]